MSTCERYDFPHAPVWCPECHARESQSIIAREMRRANDLKEREVLAKEKGYWQEEPPPPRPTIYRPPIPAPEKPKPIGGTNIEPRRTAEQPL